MCISYLSAHLIPQLRQQKYFLQIHNFFLSTMTSYFSSSHLHHHKVWLRKPQRRISYSTLRQQSYCKSAHFLDVSYLMIYHSDIAQTQLQLSVECQSIPGTSICLKFTLIVTVNRIFDICPELSLNGCLSIIPNSTVTL